MHKLIFGVLMTVSCSLFAQNQHATPNAVTTSQECEEFAYLADMYYKKSAMVGVYAEKYTLIANNFKTMHLQCMEEINKKSSYSGYRINGQQLLQTQSSSPNQKAKK